MDLGERQEMINEGSRRDLQASKIWLGLDLAPDYLLFWADSHCYIASNAWSLAS